MISLTFLVRMCEFWSLKLRFIVVKFRKFEIGAQVATANKTSRTNLSIWQKLNDNADDITRPIHQLTATSYPAVYPISVIFPIISFHFEIHLFILFSIKRFNQIVSTYPALQFKYLIRVVIENLYLIHSNYRNWMLMARLTRI